MIVWLLGLLLMTPAQAAAWVPAAAGRRDPQEDARTLLRIGKRESWLTAVGIHSRDAWSTRYAWSNAVAAGYLSPSVCPFHRRGPSARAWGTRGAWGHVAAFAMPYLPCAPPWVLDIPVVSAWVALKRLDVARRAGAPRALRAWAGTEIEHKEHRGEDDTASHRGPGDSPVELRGQEPEGEAEPHRGADHAGPTTTAVSAFPTVEQVEAQEARARAGV